MSRDVNGPFRDNKLWVLSRKCSTCIFRPGNLMHLQDGAVEKMVEDCITENRILSCHQTLDDARSVCRGLFDQHAADITVIRLAKAFDIVAFDDPPEKN